MTEDASFPLPEGNPHTFLTYGDMLARNSGYTVRTSNKLKSEQAGMATGWQGRAGAAAAAEVGRVGVIVAEQAEKLHLAAGLLKEYGTALDAAQKQVRQVQADAVEVRAEAQARAKADVQRQEVQRAFMYQDFLDGYLYTGLAPLKARYDRIITEVRQTAQTCGAKLTGMVPPAWDQSNDKAYDSVRSSFAGQLQIVSAERNGAELVAQVKALDKGVPVPAGLLDELERNLNENPWFAAAFVRQFWPDDLTFMIQNGADSGRSTDIATRLVHDASRLDSPSPVPDYVVKDVLGVPRD